jgi:hypothetical protein
MNLPQFSAAASLGPTSGIYRGRIAGGSVGAGDVLPMQGFPTTSAIGRFHLPTERCCEYAPCLGWVVCTSRLQSPFEQCICKSTCYGPVFLCRDVGAIPIVA